MAWFIEDVHFLFPYYSFVECDLNNSMIIIE